MGQGVQHPYPNPTEPLGRTDGPVFPSDCRKEAQYNCRPDPRSLWQMQFCSAAIKEPVGSPARQITKERGTSTFRLTMPMLDSMELTEKATPLSIRCTPSQPMP